MKKIILSVALATAVLSSCSLNEEPAGMLTFTDSFESVDDFARFRNGLYGDLRAIGTGFYISATELQMDMFNGVITNGNRMGTLANGNVLSSDSDIEAVWAGLYGSINTSNLMIEKIGPFIEANKESLSEEDLLELRRYEGEAKFNRAFMYFYLYQHFCQPYDAAKADVPALGLPLVTVYHPTKDRKSYPGRSTMKQTYTLIEQDLQDCYDALKEYETKVSRDAVAQNSSYLSSYTVDALRARIALYKGDYEAAATFATNVIMSRVWTLTTGANYTNLWTTDTGSELIFVPFVDADEAPYISATGTAWTSTNGVSADYICSSDLANLYDGNDLRKNFVRALNLQVNGEVVQSPCFNKFPGNPNLNSDLSLSGKNKPKMFRLSEMYLTLAEADCLKAAPNEADALLLLNDVRRARASVPAFYKDATYSGAELLQQIRRERLKELVGEGFRMFDLRRYHEGFTRSYLYANELVDQILVYAGKNVRYDVDDYRYVWPIPSAEINVNPQLVGQQNPGYN